VGLIGSAKALNPEILKTFALPHIIPSDPSGVWCKVGSYNDLLPFVVVNVAAGGMYKWVRAGNRTKRGLAQINRECRAIPWWVLKR
jgi:hypothetical protein